MGNFEKLSVLVIVVIIVMILVVAIYTWTDNPDAARDAADGGAGKAAEASKDLFEPIPGQDSGKGERTNPWDIFEPPTRTGGQPIPEPIPEPIREPIPEPIPEPTPAPQPEPTPEPTSSEPWIYTIKSGDTISQIAEKELGTWRRQKEIFALNPGLEATAIREGQPLKMPARGRTSSTLSSSGDGPAPSGPGTVSRSGRIASGEWYVTRKGDRLSRISKRAYGTIDYWPELWARNLSAVTDPDDIPAGLKIFIPKVDVR